MFRPSYGAVALVLIGLAAFLADAEPPPADAVAWEAVNIVPMPKRIRLGDRRVPLAGAVICVGAKASAQDHIGAEWINTRVRELGGKALAVAQGDPPAGDAALRLFVGTRETSPVIDRAARAGGFRLGPGVPGKHGYVIYPRKAGKATEILLGGADPVGALYACVTLAGLLERTGDGVAVRAAEIFDWPDYPTVTEGQNLYHPERGRASYNMQRGTPSKETAEAYVAAMKKHLDRLLGWKFSCFNAWEVRNWRRLNPEFISAYREVVDYAKARGIRSLHYAFQPFVGTTSDFPDAPQRCLTIHAGKRWSGLVRCWSMDEERRQTARRMAKAIAALGLTDVGFHDTDTGGFISPAQWRQRCDVCRRRWGDDFAAATLNKHMIFYEEIKKAAPECRVHFTLYPYNIAVLTQKGAEDYFVQRYGPSPSIPQMATNVRERFTDFWARMTKGFPQDVSFCIREDTADKARAFHNLVAPHGTFIYYKSGSEQWQTFFDESPRWIPTFYSGRDDFVFTVTLQNFLPLKALAVREYAWNVQTPGAAGWARLPLNERERHSEAKGEIYTVVLPHIVRSVFGRRAAPEITRALSCNVAYNQIFAPSHRTIPVLKTYEKMKWQADEAAKACADMDKFFQRFTTSTDRLGMTPYAVRRAVYMREVFHCCRWMAQSLAQDMHARKLAKAGKLAEARAAVEKGRQVIAGARRHMKQLVAERPPDAVYNAQPTGNQWKRRWRMYTPVHGVDFGTPEKLLAQTEKELPGLAAAGELPAGVLRNLSRRSLVHCAPRVGAIQIDGRLDEPDWRRTLPVEALFVYPEQKHIARAHTRARLLRDDATLYFGATCWMPAGAPIRASAREHDGPVGGDEHVELFLMPPHLNGGYLHLVLNAAGSMADKRVTLTRNADGAEIRKMENEWNATGAVVKTTREAGRWELEAAIPLAALGARNWNGRWRVNVCRDFKGAAEDVELSSIMRPGGRNFHDTKAFPQLNRDDTPALPPEVEVTVKELNTRTRTMDDRVATVAEFGVEVGTGRIVYQVRLSAEAYDETGRLHFRKTLKTLDRVVYSWRPKERFTIGFEREVKQGGIRVVLEADGARGERWIRLGGWQGTPQAGALFSPPSAGASANDFRASPGLIGPCILPAATLAGPGKAERILGRRLGTIEFWLKPRWRRPHPLDWFAGWQPSYTLLHCGVLRRQHPWLANHSAFTITYDLRRGDFYCAVRTTNYAGWNVGDRAGKRASWAHSRWHHLACVWDHQAQPDDWLRLYLDGKRVKGKTGMSKPERLGKDKSLRLADMAFALQLLSLNSGRAEAPVIMDELRVSRTARYAADFAPAHAPLQLDKDTVALFHFDGNLAGEGMSARGQRYDVHGTAGVLEYH